MFNFVSLRTGPPPSSKPPPIPLPTSTILASSFVTKRRKGGIFDRLINTESLSRAVPFLGKDAGLMSATIAHSSNSKARAKFIGSSLGTTVISLLRAYSPTKPNLIPAFIGLAEMESDFDPSLQSNESSAKGAIQIINEEWIYASSLATDIIARQGSRSWSAIAGRCLPKLRSQALASFGVLEMLDKTVKSLWKWNGSRWVSRSLLPGHKLLSDTYPNLMEDVQAGYFLLMAYHHTNGINAGPSSKIHYLNKLGAYSTACLSAAAMRTFGLVGDIEPAMPLDVVVPVIVKSKYGMRNFINKDGVRVHRFHYGIDIRAKVGTPFYSPVDGVIKTVGLGSGWGRYILLEGSDPKEAFRFAHLSKFKVKQGETVRKGQLLGLSGASDYNRTSGIRENGVDPHIHFEWFKNPDRVTGSDGSDPLNDNRGLYKTLLTKPFK